MEQYRPEEIVGDVKGLKSLKNPEAKNFASHNLKDITDSDQVGLLDANGFYDHIKLDHLNKNIAFSFNDRDSADFYRAVEFGEEYTLIESIKDRSPKDPGIDTDFSNKDGATVLHYLTTDDRNYIFEDGNYRLFPNDSATRAHKKSQEILEERPFDGRMLEPIQE